jgi:outer membrane protein insertion porin family
MVKSARLGIWIIGILLAGSAVFAQQPKQTIIERVDIRGNRRIPEETIRFYIQSRPGEPYDERRLEFDLRALFKANWFENIEIEERDGDTGKIITFVLKEKPLIRSIEYSGNKSFTESDILDEFKEKKVGLTVDSQYDPAKIRAAERTLKDLMTQNGKPLGTVETIIENIPPSSVKVRFVMDEGPKVRIGQIRFVGEKVFSDGTLKKALKLNKERGMVSMFKGTDKYHRDKLDADIEMNLKAFYKEHGYMQVQVGEPVTRIFEGPRGSIPFMRKTRQQFYVEIPIVAGDQFRLGKLELQNCGMFDCEKLATLFGLKKGDVVNFKQIKDTLEQMKKLYGNAGYINWSYLPEQNMNPQNKTMDLIFRFEPDKQFLVRRIDFQGNTKTRDKVMRREFVLEEGRIFSSALLDASVLRLNQLGFFDKIEEKDYEVKPDDKTGLVDVVVNVKEKSQRSIGFTGGVSGISGSFLGLNYSDNNFLGRGESLEVSISGGTRTANFLVAFTEPYLMDTRWSLGLSVFNTRYRYDTYSAYGITDIYTGEPVELFTQKTTGTTLNLSRRIGYTPWTFGGSYSYQSISITNIAPGFEPYALGQFTGFTPGQDPKAALQGIIRSEVTPMLSYNTTNSYFNATRGSSIHISAAVTGGILGGDFSMIRPSVVYRRFFPDRWLSGGRNTFGINLQGQYIQAYNNSSVPFFERFFIGGENTIRGFDIRSISPLALVSTRQFDSKGVPIIDLKTGLPAVTQSLISVGGDTVAICNFEYRIPIAGPLSLAAFYDIGIARVSRTASLGDFGSSQVEMIDASNNKPHSSTGIEIQFVLPVVSAPFRLIFAYNPQRLNEDITLGTQTIRLREPSGDIKFTVGRSF